MRKGANAFDVSCHRIFDMSLDVMNGHKTGVHCLDCGQELEYIYCEERLYLIRCKQCRIISMVEAASPAAAAYKTLCNAFS